MVEIISERERESLPRFRGIWGRICCCCCCRGLTVDREKVGVVGIWEIFEIGDLEEGMEPRKWKKTAINLWYSPTCPRTRRRRGNRLLFYFTWPYPRVGFMFSRQLINHSQSVFFFFLRYIKNGKIIRAIRNNAIPTQTQCVWNSELWNSKINHSYFCIINYSTVFFIIIRKL